MAAVKSADAIVAPGRSVHVGATTSSSFDRDRKEMVDVVKPEKVALPGEKVTLPEPEIRRLQALGFLLKAGVDPLPTGIGPTFGTSEGPSINAAG
jgi:hypothetical protein